MRGEISTTRAIENYAATVAGELGDIVGQTLFVYDEAGHLLGEYDELGNRIREYVWLGDKPVAMLEDSGSNPTRFTDFYGLEITGEYHSFSASISDWEYLGLTADLSRGDLVDRLVWFNFSASGFLAVTIKCVEKDTCDRPIQTWYPKGTVQVNDARLRIPYTEPALPIPGMGYVILADKMLRAGEHIKQAKDQIMMAGKTLLNAPTAICNGAPFQKM